jgi:hypothetical protein
MLMDMQHALVTWRAWILLLLLVEVGDPTLWIGLWTTWWIELWFAARSLLRPKMAVRFLLPDMAVWLLRNTWMQMITARQCL